jgi:diazepam-binding inhibitor (GABA receptor modulating acyl-CoA-binding protein)
LIVSLSGAFQPADQVKLKFYALYKQATCGPNKSRRPAFYDLVAKFKWDAWANLGDMSTREAMQLYIDELVKVTGFN